MKDLEILNEIFPNKKPVIGMVHLRALPGAPLYDPILMGIDRITKIAVNEAKILEASGVDGLQIENIWDFPYLKGGTIGYETVAAMAAIAVKVKEAVSIPIGVNCHLNAALESMAVATAVGAKWIRVFEYVNAYVSHAGIIEGIGAELARYRSNLKADNIKMFCDVNVKHGSHFIVSDRSIIEQAHDAVNEGAEALIVTGFETGIAPSSDNVKDFADNVNKAILIGSGVTQDNVKDLLKYADGLIVGSYFKKDNNWKNEIEAQKVVRFMKEVERIREGS
jgi:membrane complex biogenesis BtpA family protein